MKHALVVTTAAAAALLLGGCGGSSTQTQPATSPPTPSASETSQPATSGAATESSAAAATSQAAQAGPALCKAGSLTATTDSSGGGAAGSVYMQLIVTNSGTEPCLLKGYAGVSLTAGADGEPIGAAATRDDSTPVTDVLLAPGKAGAATLRYTQAANYPDCTRTPAAGLRVYPPDDTDSLFLAQPLDACANTEINLLIIGAFQPK
ncbi:hypothetical protein SRABI26_03182 [Arthrobacter sp. Bi26]|uniref:DUF4232 domain-containing protein n=1 Tax=Arthrobacter sp. Bi26 TaxID=2822350 RepID=UPI001D58B5BA|nr:DUF4232 domain-containing protein [Arthrobacter sp. Bi26]CAH0252504.1 hypothetical protein SRABI26_03182 [Arthrobacter sp. Bi26]